MIDVPKLLTPKLLRPTLVLTERARSFLSATTVVDADFAPNFIAYTDAAGRYYTNAAGAIYGRIDPNFVAYTDSDGYYYVDENNDYYVAS